MGNTTTRPTSPAPTSSSAAPPTSGAAATNSAIADGTYLLGASPNCGDVPVDGSPLTVQGDMASIMVSPNDPPVPGSVAYQPSGFHIHVANGTALVIDLTGTVNAAGALTGTGQSGGMHPSGTGWVCNFAFSATLETG